MAISACWSAVRDHPRSRGEYASDMSALREAAGSSPLSRGIRSSAAPGRWTAGIIPALAGNTWGPEWLRSGYRDHPRSRGEYARLVEVAGLGPGSSPLSRGIRGCRVDLPDDGGIIPALAGNTHPWPPLNATSRDHPRSRGEYRQAHRGRAPGAGSSPLSRGIHDPVADGDGHQRIIPALAGNTS